MKEQLLNAFIEMQSNYFKEIQKENIKDEPNKEALLVNQTIIDTLNWAIGVVKAVAASEATEKVMPVEKAVDDVVDKAVDKVADEVVDKAVEKAVD